MKFETQNTDTSNPWYEIMKQYNALGSTKQSEGSRQYPVFSPPQLSFPIKYPVFYFPGHSLVTTYILRFLLAANLSGLWIFYQV